MPMFQDYLCLHKPYGSLTKSSASQRQQSKRIHKSKMAQPVLPRSPHFPCLSSLAHSCIAHSFTQKDCPGTVPKGTLEPSLVLPSTKNSCPLKSYLAGTLSFRSQLNYHFLSQYTLNYPHLMPYTPFPSLSIALLSISIFLKRKPL